MEDNNNSRIISDEVYIEIIHGIKDIIIELIDHIIPRDRHLINKSENTSE